MKRIIALGCCLMFLVPVVDGEEFNWDWTAQEYSTAPGDLGVPATRWDGTKYAQGTVSVLVFKDASVNYSNMRQVMELGQAFDLNLKHVMASYGNANRADNARALALLKERHWDVFVFWSGGYTSIYTYLDEDVRARIRMQVVDGAGLLFLQGFAATPPELCPKEMALGVPTNALLGGIGLTGRAARNKLFNSSVGEIWQSFGSKTPLTEEALKARSYSLYALGKGRVLSRGGFFVKTYSGGLEALPWSPAYCIDADYMMAEVGRALWVAADRAPQVEFIESPPALWSLAWDAPAGSRSAWVLNVAGKPRTLSVTWRIRDLTGRKMVQDRREFPKASGPIECPVALPALDAGRYYLDVFVDGPAGRETYGYSAIEVASPVAVALGLQKAAIQPGELVHGTVQVRTSTENGPAAESVRLKLIDNESRIIDQKTVAVTSGQVIDFNLDPTGSESLALDVAAEALIGGRVAGADCKAAVVLRRGLDRFNVVLWGNTSGTPYNYWINRKLRRTGVTSVTCVDQASVTGPDPGTRANLTRLPFIAAWDTWSGEIDGRKVSFSATPARDTNGVVSIQPFSWNDTPNFDRMLALEDRHWKRGMESPTLMYNLYDEGPHSGCDLTPAGLAAYRDWLREQYGGKLEALNQEWQSQYKSWDEVTVLEPNDNLEEKAKEKKLYARWSDRNRFNQANFARTVLRGLTRHARAIDPQARVGFEGSGGFGMDIDEVLHPDAAGFWAPYDGLQTDLVRSLRPDGFIHGFWVGYDKDAPVLTSYTWRMVTHGAPSVWFWCMSGYGEFHGWLAPNSMPYPQGQQFMDDCILPLRRGLGDLLMRLPMQHSGIALYYSVAGVHAGDIPESAPFNQVSAAHASFISLLGDCGLQWVYTTKQKVLDGDLKRRGIKLLILPYQQALGADEVTALTQFVQAGGTVLADLRPGVCSGHARPWPHGPADALFGVERTGNGKAERMDGNLNVQFLGKPLALSLQNNRADAEVKAAAATAGGMVGGKQVFFVNQLGKGQAILLNFHLSQYGNWRAMASGRSVRRFFTGLADGVGVRSELVRTDGKDGELVKTETSVWRQGGVSLYSLFREEGAESAAEIRLPQRGHVFSLRAGPQGETDVYKVNRIESGYADFFAVYPYDPGRPVVRADKTAVKGGDLVNVDLAMSGAPADETGTFSYHTQLFDPQGNWVDVTPWSVQGTGGRARMRIRFAYNDAPGTWKLVAREVTTGRAAECRLGVKALDSGADRRR